jgi:two-component system KDP operon response regulator KdpE
MELLARIKSIIRRQTGTGSARIEKIGDFQFDLSKNKVRYKERPVNLTKTETTILYQLAINCGKAVSNSSLAASVWETDYPDSADAIRVYIRHLREKLEISPNKPQLILTKPGVGYMLVRSA